MTYNAEPQSSQSSPIVQTIRPGVELLNEEVGIGEIVKKHAFYQIRLRMWLSRGEAVRLSTPFGLMTRSRVEDDGTTLITEVRIDRVFLFAGLFYGVQGMRVGGTRTLRIAPHLGYREAGIPDRIPPNALLIAEVAVLAVSSANPVGEAAG